MKLIALRLFALAICASGLAHAQIQAPDLQPEEEAFVTRSKPYSSAVYEQLLSHDPYRKYQMLFLPSFQRENAVYILRNEMRPRAEVTVVVTEAKRQIWGTMMERIEKNT